MNETYFDLASRLEDSFHEIENDALSDLAETNEEYVKLQAQISRLKLQNQFIGELIDGRFEGALSEQQSAALVKFIDLYMDLEEMERKHLYFRGHTDAFAYLKKLASYKARRHGAIRAVSNLKSYLNMHISFLICT